LPIKLYRKEKLKKKPVPTNTSTQTTKMNTSDLRSIITPIISDAFKPKPNPDPKSNCKPELMFREEWLSDLIETLAINISKLNGKTVSPNASPTVAKDVVKATPEKTATKKAEPAKKVATPTKKAEKKEKAEVESFDDIATIVAKWRNSSKKTIGKNDVLFFDIGTKRISIYKGKCKEDEFEEGKFYYLKTEGLNTIHGLRIAKEDKAKLDVFRSKAEEEEEVGEE
jgi:hypothetical protein